MLELKDTGLEEFSFGDASDDKFYILVNKKISPDGIDVKKLSKANPMKFDATLNEMGCILMLNGIEVAELCMRGELDNENLHESMFELAKEEGLF
ncbi:hypothetical protein [Gracilimonas tropica]|uniref:hypothetical protein n=1 Tax=Gracilimonas tropica TaxID=454600 RepID=UPI000368C12C|nr:hypothetical protein [Gracilimonas tropica]